MLAKVMLMRGGIGCVLIILLAGCGINSDSAGKSEWFVGATYFGLTKIKDHTFDSIRVNGLTRLEKVIVMHATHINGKLNAKQSEFRGRLFVNGQVELVESIVLGKTHINGFLLATNSSFGEMEIAADLVILTDSEAKNIFIRDNNQNKQQVIELEDTTVNGNVYFERVGGIVTLKGDSKIMGDVIGAKVKDLRFPKS